MKHMLMICDDEPVILSPAEVHALPQTQAPGCGSGRPGSRRQHAAPAGQRCHRPRPRRRVLVSGGPFAETKEQMGGFDIIECANLDEAAEIAARHPAAASGAIEARPPLTGVKARATPQITRL
jgi:hypothetical protein